MAKQRAQARVPTAALRRDAAANYERILVAAAVAIRRDGPKVPLATIAEGARVGVGTLYRHFPTREALFTALAIRAFRLVLDHAREAADSDEPAINSIARFFERTISRRDDLILPLHGAPVSRDPGVAGLRTAVREALEEVLRRGRADGTVRGDVTAADIIITGAQLAQPLANAADWDQIARRQAALYLGGLSPTALPPLSGNGVTQAGLETRVTSPGKAKRHS
jgi:AcrR family transcriptional regulator